MESKKIISIAILSLLIFAMFFTAVRVLASAEVPSITVSPISVRPGQRITVKGSGFPPDKTVDIYMDVEDGYHKLGSVVTTPAGRFSFSFEMQPSYLGTHTIMA